MNDLAHLLHINFVFQALSLATIVVLMWQVKIADQLDRLRGHRRDWLFSLRRTAMFLKGAALCWMVAYSAEMNWEPWPPIIGFLAAVNLRVMTEIAIMKRDIAARRPRGESIRVGGR